jgi:chemotaxis protein methyltransferase CheR
VTDEIWQTLAALFRSWTGMMVPHTMRAAAVREVTRMAEDAGCPPMPFLRSLHEDGEARQELMDRIGLGTTWFLREQAGLFALVEKLGRLDARAEPVQVWSAGCSSGEEPYSLAMALLEAGVPARILATDINRRALWRGLEGLYPRRALARLPAHWRARYFEDAGPDMARITDDVRRCVTFELHNFLAEGALPVGWYRFDAIVCRNVLVYFERAEATALLDRLAARCHAGGYLLLSAIERPLFWMGNVATVCDTAALVQVPLRRPDSRPAPGRASAPRAERPMPGAIAPGAPERRLPARPATSLDTVPDAVDDLDDLLARAEAAEQARRMDEALALLDAAVAHAPLVATAHLARGLLLKRAMRLVEAIDSLRAARFLDGHAWLAPYQLALCLEATGEQKEADEAYRYALDVIESGGPPGLSRASLALEALATTVAEVCRNRVGAREP